MMKKIKKSQFLVLLSVLTATLVALFGLQNNLRIREYTIYIEDLPAPWHGAQLLQISDLHSSSFGPQQAHLLATINTIKPDLILITGDLIDKRQPKEEPVSHLLDGIEGYQTFFVTGNHEWWLDFSIQPLLQRKGVEILSNRGVVVERGGEKVVVLGVDDPYTKRDDLAQAISTVPAESRLLPKILLAHAPSIFAQAADASIDLTLCGHTHGGQVRLPFLGALVAPGQGWFPRYDYGFYKEGKAQMIISGGLGNSVIPLRFFNPPELVLITLQPSEKNP